MIGKSGHNSMVGTHQETTMTINRHMQDCIETCLRCYQTCSEWR